MEHYFADPRRGSIHSYGMAVDVTLLDAQGREADMGSGFDEMSEASHPALHAEHMASGVLSAAQVAERDCLHGAMVHGGFQGTPTEWWHFDFGDRERVRRELPVSQVGERADLVGLHEVLGVAQGADPTGGRK